MTAGPDGWPLVNIMDVLNRLEATIDAQATEIDRLKEELERSSQCD